MAREPGNGIPKGGKACDGCGVRAGWITLTRRTWAIVLLSLASLGAAGGAAVSAIVEAADVANDVEHLLERQLEASEERRRNSARWAEIQASLARIEGRMDEQERRRTAGRSER